MNMQSKVLPILFFLSIATACLPAFSQTREPQPKEQASAATRSHQTSFATPQDAVSKLVMGMRANDRHLLHQVLGPDAHHFIQSKDAKTDEEARTKFLAAYDEKSRIEPLGDSRAVLHVGHDDWPFPFPMVKRGNRWHFDARAGEQEWADRRIGEHELSAIQVCLAYVDAQREYALKDSNQNGLLDYAQHIVSSPGQHDGLYWPRAEGQPVSPMGQAFAAANKSERGAGRLESRPYHGYYFRILTAQGKYAQGGAMDYMAKGKLIGGFALIAYPAKYRESGVKTFIVDHGGVVYSKDLGPKTESVAEATTRFDPDPSWQKENQ